VIPAELHGKLGDRGANANERLEDLLTSNVLGTLRYLPIGLGFAQVLARAQSIANPGVLDALPIDLATLVEGKLHFWPRAPGVGECDALLVMRDCSGSFHALLIEAKYHSGKSSTATEEEDLGGAESRAHDQLARYLVALAAGEFEQTKSLALASRGLLYLTAHAAMPVNELEESRVGAQARGVNDPLYWLSWRDITRALRPLRGQGEQENQCAISDILDLLERRGLIPFRGVRAPPFSALPTGYRRRPNRWCVTPLRPLPSWRAEDSRARWHGTPRLPEGFRTKTELRDD
jgi:hypothetical protein